VICHGQLRHITCFAKTCTGKMRLEMIFDDKHYV